MITFQDNTLAELKTYLVAAENNWNVLTDADEIAVPSGYVLISDTGSHVEHDNCTLKS